MSIIEPGMQAAPPAAAEHTLGLDEGERRMVLMALAHLAVERPGWDHALSEVALRIDNEENGRPQMYDDFRRPHARR